MANEFDHIEDSIRNAFDKFEMPVNDMDWSRISAALPEDDKKGGFFFWWKKNKGKGLLIALIALTSASALVYNAVSNKPVQSVQKTSTTQVNTEEQASQKDNQAEIENKKATAEIQADAPVQNQIPNSSPISGGTATAQNRIAPNNISAPTAGIRNTPNANGNAAINSTPAPTSVEVGTPKPSIPAANPTPTQPSPEVTVEPVPNFGWLQSLAIRLFKNPIPSIGASFKIFNKIGKVNSPNEPSIKPTLGYYGLLQTSYAPGQTKAIQGNEIWQKLEWLGGNRPALNLRIEGGIEYGAKTTFTIGGAIEGNPLAGRASDSIRIQIADRFLPYYDINGKLLYMLAIRWRDSVIVMNHNGHKTWAEIPLGIKHIWALSKNLNFSAGLTANPGILLGSSGNIVNPYQSFSGSYLKYKYGIDADTTATFVAAKSFQNNTRLGSGLQLGIEKQTTHFNWGIQLQTRYYFTPEWKQGVSIQQNTIQYGINARVGFKF